MKKNKCLAIICLLWTMILSCQSINKVEEKEIVDYVSYVNPLMGTDSEFNFSNGNTYPAIALPWGMNFWTPMTSKAGDGWTYKYSAKKIYGIKQTHQPSPWINDYGAFALMPVTGELKYKEDERPSWFSHKAEQVNPYYYRVYLADYDVVAEVTPTERAAQFRFTFPKNSNSYIILDAFFKGSQVKIIPEERKIIGYCKNNSGGVPDNFKNYFVAVFDKDFEEINTWGDKWKLKRGIKESIGDHVGAIVKFTTKRGERIGVKVASSFISIEQAEQNLFSEVGKDTFDESKNKGYNAWQKELKRIEVEDANVDNLRIFYSCLYRTLLFPRKFYEVTKGGKVMHYSPYNGKVLPGYMFTDNGFWDTFRAVFPFFNLMYPDLTKDIMKGLANTYKESGWLPEWASPGHRNCMIGSNSAPIIADAFLKGNMDESTAEILFEAILKNANVEKGRPEESVGRAGLNYYNTLGYVPYDVGINENAARTLEYAFADFAIAEMAKKMGKDSTAQRFYKQAKNYNNLFDKSTGWMRGKNKDGSFQSPFNVLKWGDAFTEGNSIHYTWSVFHDVNGLMELMGGRYKFVEALDKVFTMPPVFDDSYYGFTIHEIREMQVMNMGNYAHGNQPIQHMIYLYNYAGKAYKTQEKVRNVLNKLYKPTPDGYCGDEDNGQTSAWYVFSSLGFYPVTPTIPQYVIGSPIFKKVKLHLKSGKEFIISTKNNSSKNVYINDIRLNGNFWNKSYINYQDIKMGGVINFDMSDIPNKKLAVEKNAYPFSMSLDYR